MNIHHLELFYYVARHGGISRAVRRMPYGIQQPAVSSQLLKLEEELGTKLFDRNPFALTADGRQLYDFAAPFFEGMDTIARQIRQRAAPLLRVGAAEIVLRDYLPTVVERIRKRLHNLQLGLRSGYTQDLQNALLEREIDVAVTPLEGRPPARLNCLRLLSLPVVLLVPAAAPIGSLSELWARDHVETPLISLPRDETISRVFQQELKRRGVDWPVSIEASSVDLITSYVANGYGYGVTMGAPELIRHPRVRVLEFEDIARVDVGIMWFGQTSPVVAAFIEEGRRLAGELPHAPPELRDGDGNRPRQSRRNADIVPIPRPR